MTKINIGKEINIVEHQIQGRIDAHKEILVMQGSQLNSIEKTINKLKEKITSLELRLSVYEVDNDPKLWKKPKVLNSSNGLSIAKK